MKTTRAEVMRRNGKVVEVGYCGLSNTLREVARKGRDFYTWGIYGWNADIYEFREFAICTGYRPFGNAYLPQGFTKKWETKAKALYDKIYTKKADGTYYTYEQGERLRLKFRLQFEAAVMKELAKQEEAKGKKRKAA